MQTILNHRQQIWLVIYVLGVLLIGLSHHIQQGKEAWTPSRKSAWKKTLLNLAICFVMQVIVGHYTSSIGILYTEYRGFSVTFKEFLIFVLVEDALFYWLHRWLHSNKTIYHWIHAYHHISHKDVTLVNGLQITFFELLLSILLPGTLPLMFTNMNIICYEVVNFVSLFGILCDHGLDIFPQIMIPFPLNGTKHHLRHHERVRGNYSGPLSIWDYICNTQLYESHREEIKENNDERQFELSPEQAS